MEGLKMGEADARNVYADIIDHPHHQSPVRPHMSLYNRAAQFSAFDALSGFSDMVTEEARLTDTGVHLSEEALERLNQKLTLINDVIEDGYNPEIRIVYFEPDRLKDGGAYLEYTGTVKQIDLIGRKIVFLDSGNGEIGDRNRKTIRVDMERIIEIHGELLDYLDESL